MKIFHLINTFSAGGAELHLLALCQHLKKMGAMVSVACLREQVRGSRSLWPDFEHAAIRVIKLEANGRYDGRFIPRLVHLLKNEQPDIIHTHLPRADFAGALGHLLYPCIPWVCSIHDIYSKSWSGSWTLALFNRVWQRSDALIAISQAVKDWLVQERHIPFTKVTVIHYGIEAERYRHLSTDFQDSGNAREGQVIGAIGRLEPRKGHAILIRAMPGVLQQVPQASLLIAGHDPWKYGQVLKAAIAGLDLKQQVQLLGFRDDVPGFLQTLDVFALASHSEGFGQVIIEAMAAGKPVVASKIPTLMEIVVEGETGLLVEPENPKAFAEAICWLLTHPHEARAMGKRGQERVRSHFSAERMAAQTLAIYRELLGAHHVQARLA
jgi:glycosyltransferase involved in cell wall biosynthesis